MIRTARQLKDLIRNLAKKKSADAQILMRNYMMERFLERISLSEYRDNFILKGGMLVSAMVGLDARSTMDLDATIKGINVNVEEVENLIACIITVPIEDGVKFHLKSISEIMEEAEYPGIRVSMSATFDGVVTPLKIDISTGDAITPKEVQYSFKLMLEERFIDIWAYNLETVLAEKLETIITRATTNTRMRDFYDIYILEQLYGKTLNPDVFQAALQATAQKRETERYLTEAEETIHEVENSDTMQALWAAYQEKFSYAAELKWDMVIPGAVITRLSWERYFSAVDRISESRLSLHSSRLSMWERMLRSFSACSAHISPSTAARISTSVAFMCLVRKSETSVIFSVGFSRIRAVIAEAVLPNAFENTSSSLKLETVKQFCARFFSPVVKLVSFQR